MGILKKIQSAIGLDECKVALTGAAPISTETLEYFGSLGISVHELYGMSECASATTISTVEKHIWGSCGYQLPGTQVKVFKVDETDNNKKTECPRAQDIFNPAEKEQGELCFRGRHIMMGYLANPDLGQDHVQEIERKTKESIDDEGWLHSGDMACVGAHGMIRVTGRYKELIIGSGGENIAPVPIEDHIKKVCPAISNVMMVGDKRKFNTCLVTLKTEEANGETPGTDNLFGAARSVVEGITTVSAAIESTDYKKVIEDAIKSTNNNSIVCPSNAAKIQKFKILPHDFSIQNDELTPTLKLKRNVVEKMWASHIHEMYAE